MRQTHWHNLFNRFNHPFFNREVTLLACAFLMLLGAIAQPNIHISRTQKNYLFIVDVTQSMNVKDMLVDGKPSTRLEYSKQLIKDTVKSMPCRTHVGLGIFFKTTATLLYTPMETCSNYHEIWHSIDRLDWRMASQGNSNIRVGLLSIASLLVTSDDNIAHIVFLTDGQEAPPLNIFSKTSLSDWQDQHPWTIVGVGGKTPLPIPKLDANNAVIGYWSTDAIKLNPASNVDEGHHGGRDNTIATEPYEYYLSQLETSYLKELAMNIHAQYITAGTPQQLIQALNQQPRQLQFQTKLALKPILAFFALIFVIAIYMPDMKKTAVKRLKKYFD